MQQYDTVKHAELTNITSDLTANLEISLYLNYVTKVACYLNFVTKVVSWDHKMDL